VTLGGPLTTSGISAAAVRSSTTPPIGRQLAELKGSDTVARDNFGSSVAISGTTAVVSTSGTDYAGRAYVFTKTSSGWKQTAELVGSDVVSGDEFGPPCLSGYDRCGGCGEPRQQCWAGVRVHEDLFGLETDRRVEGLRHRCNDWFGWSVAVFDRTIVVGASGHGNYAGRAYVFTNTAVLGRDRRVEGLRHH